METRFRMTEHSTGIVEGDIVDQDGLGVPAASLTSAMLTLWDWHAGAHGGSPRPGIINGRDEQDVLNANNVIIDTDGHFAWSVQPEDNGLPDDPSEWSMLLNRGMWRHRALLVFTWATGSFQYEFEIDVKNLRLTA